MTTLSRYDAQPAKIKTSFFFLLLLILGVPMQLQAAHLVTAKYLRIAGQEVEIEISISDPPPSTLIVIQNLPAQTSIIQAQPETKSINRNKGEVKWLLSNIKVGNLAVRLTLDRPISSEEISGEIRYREIGGDMVTMPITQP